MKLKNYGTWWKRTRRMMSSTFLNGDWTSAFIMHGIKNFKNGSPLKKFLVSHLKNKSCFSKDTIISNWLLITQSNLKELILSLMLNKPTYNQPSPTWQNSCKWFTTTRKRLLFWTLFNATPLNLKKDRKLKRTRWSSLVMIIRVPSN